MVVPAGVDRYIHRGQSKDLVDCRPVKWTSPQVSYPLSEEPSEAHCGIISDACAGRPEVLNPLVLVIAAGEEGLVVLDEVSSVTEVVAEEEYPFHTW